MCLSLNLRTKALVISAQLLQNMNEKYLSWSHPGDDNKGVPGKSFAESLCQKRIR